MTWAIAIALTAGLAPPAQPLPYRYVGWFTGIVEVRTCPMTGYYYLPCTPLPPVVLQRVVVVKVKVVDGGPTCHAVTRYRTYLFSPMPLPGRYLLPHPIPPPYPPFPAPVGVPFKPIGPWGWEVPGPWPCGVPRGF